MHLALAIWIYLFSAVVASAGPSRRTGSRDRRIRSRTTATSTAADGRIGPSRVARRRKTSGFAQALEKQVSIDFVDTPLGEVVRHLGRENEIPIVIDHPALDDLGIVSDTQMTIELRDVTLRSALHHLLRELDLTFLAWNEALVITSIDAALGGNYSVTRVYPVYDLLPKNLSGQIDYDSLISAIQFNVSPDSWPDGGGGIDSYAGTLIILQYDEVHREIEEFLAALRRGVEPKMLELSDSPARDFFRGGGFHAQPLQKNEWSMHLPLFVRRCEG